VSATLYHLTCTCQSWTWKRPVSKYLRGGPRPFDSANLTPRY